MTHQPAKIIFGGGVFVTSDDEYSKPENMAKLLDSIERHGITTIDTAKAYKSSEELLGQNNATARFTVDTKYPGGMNQSPSTMEIVFASGMESLQSLNTDSVDVYYIHVPDARVPLEVTLEGIDKLYRKGAFRRFGVSNFTVAMVEDAVRIAKARGFVLPSVYQGNYNAVTRRMEASLFPVLRKHSIAFYAFSPIAGGFLAKRREDLAGGVGTGRWDPKTHPGSMYNEMYVNPKMLEGLDKWGQIAKDEEISKVELAYRWAVFNSVLRGELGDGVILGARNDAQLNEVMAGIKKGALSDEVSKKIDELWEIIKDDAPSDDPTKILQGLLA